jgi:hypothetical protein
MQAVALKQFSTTGYGVVDVGQEIDISEELGFELIQSGLLQRLSPAVVETATAQRPQTEQAVRHGGKSQWRHGRR